MEKEQIDYFIHLPKLTHCQGNYAWVSSDENYQLSSKTLSEATTEAKEKYAERKKELIDYINHPFCTMPKAYIPKMEEDFPKKIVVIEVSKYTVLI